MHKVKMLSPVFSGDGEYCLNNSDSISFLCKEMHKALPLAALMLTLPIHADTIDTSDNIIYENIDSKDFFAFSSAENHVSSLSLNLSKNAINFLLDDINLLPGETVKLNGNIEEITSYITGSGNIMIDVTDTVILNNAANDYTGTTTVSNGTLQLGSNNALGNTNSLIIENSANVDINGMNQTIGNLNGSGNLNINNGVLDIYLGGEFDGIISGDGGQLNISGGTLTLSGNNIFNGQTIINSGAQLSIGNGGTTGSYIGDITNNGILAFNRSDNFTYSNVINGMGELHQNGTGILSLTSSDSNIGSIHLNAGGLEIAAASTVTIGTNFFMADNTTLYLIPDSDIYVAGEFHAAANSTIHVTLVEGQNHSVLSSNYAYLDGNLVLNGYTPMAEGKASDLENARYRLIESATVMDGDFSSVTLVDSESPVDYLTLSSDVRKLTNIWGGDSWFYTIGLDLTWYAGQEQGNGVFTLTDAADSFDVDVSLTDQSDAFVSGWDGKRLTKNGEGILLLSAQNTYTGETLINSGKLQMGIDNAIADSSAVYVAKEATFNLNNFNQTAQNITGTGEITLGTGALTAVNTQDTQFDGRISGDGSLVKQGANAFTLTNTHTYLGGTTVSAGTLQLGNGGTLGSIVGNVLNHGTLIFNRSNEWSFDGTIDGPGVLQHDGSGTTTLTASNLYTGSTIVNNGTLRLNGNGALGSGNVVLGENGNLFIDTPMSGNYVFNNSLSGQGQLIASLADKNQSFDFGSTTGNAFVGTFTLNQGSILLAGNNVDSLTNATLNLGANGSTTINADQTIGNITFSGGQFNTSMNSPNAADILTVNYLNVDGVPSLPGTVNLSGASLPAVSQPTGNILLHGNINTNDGIQVIAADSVSTVGKQLALLLDNVAPEDQVYVIDDGFGNTDVRATYGYGAVTTNTAEGSSHSAGLYVGYLLKVLESQSNAILDSTGAENTSFGVQLTGTGNFEFRANNDSITLVNATNDYQGETLVSSGILRLGADNALGQTSALNISSQAQVDINGFTQTVGELNTDVASLLNLNNGHLTLTNGGVSQGSLSGNGQLTLAGGTFIVNQANTELLAATAINSGATAKLGDAKGLGRGDIALNGELIFDQVTDDLANNLSGSGLTQLTNGSDLTLTGNNTAYTGMFDIESGNRLVAASATNLGASIIHNNGNLELKANENWQFTNAVVGSGSVTKTGNGAVIINDSYAYTGGTNVEAGVFALQSDRAALIGGGPVTIANNATLGGYGLINGNVTNQGTLAVANALTLLTGNSGNLNIQGNLDNQGAVRLAGRTVGNTLTVNGNYIGTGRLLINTVLAGDDSLTDKLIVKGDTSGKTAVTVNNVGGSGAQTSDGIQIVAVEGSSNGDFSLANRVVAGAYDYRLFKGSASDPNDGNWYLRTPDTRFQPEVDVIDAFIPTRPEVGAYMANQDAAVGMFIQSLHDRFGDSQFMSGNGIDSREPNTWGRIIGNYTHTRVADQIKQRSWGSAVQLGGDLYRNHAERNSINAGIMAGYGTSKSRNTSDYDGLVARSELRGYSVGAYGTWFADGQDGSEGAYLDVWTQYGWYHNEVKGERLAEESYHSRTFAGSLEGGWTFNIWETQSSRLFIQPQAQVIYTDYTGRDVHEENGTYVRNNNDGGFITRLGVRLFGQQKAVIDQNWRPFIETNWLHNDTAARVSMNGETFDSGIPKDRLEVKTGMEGQLNANWQLWGNVGVQKGDGDYKSALGTVGVKYLF